MNSNYLKKAHCRCCEKQIMKEEGIEIKRNYYLCPSCFEYIQMKNEKENPTSTVKVSVLCDTTEEFFAVMRGIEEAIEPFTLIKGNPITTLSEKDEFTPENELFIHWEQNA